MTSLNFKGKSAVWNHHLSVPFHTLDEDKKLSLQGDNADENLIIQGDNLLALKALLPKYQGKVKCIYIDPPYNTGKEGWVYNDAVSSPEIKSWLGKTVGEDDLTRHEKWACMITPRIKLLRDLLSDSGLIFISIDDNEIHHLRMLLNEIFDEENFVATMVRQGLKGGTGPTNEIRKTHDYVLVYAKDKESSDLAGIELDSEPLDQTDEKGPFRKGRELNKWGAGSRREDSPTMWFPVKGPNNEDVYPIRNDGSEGRWRWGKTKLSKAVADGDVLFEKRENGTYIVYEKIREENPRRKSFSTLELTNADGTEDIKKLFEGKTPFDYPKPVDLVKFVIQLCANEDGDVVLDSFAGSGTTGQATMELSSDDGVTRRYILIQLPEEIKKDSAAYTMGYRFVHEVTRDRIVRAIKQGNQKDGFTYYKLGPAIDAETMLSGELPTYENFAKYVYYLASGKDHPETKQIDAKSYFVGKTDRESIYLMYEQDQEKLKTLAITLKWAQDTDKKDKGKKVVYAPACYLDEDTLEKYQIQFVSIPYNLFERKEL